MDLGDFLTVFAIVFIVFIIGFCVSDVARREGICRDIGGFVVNQGSNCWIDGKGFVDIN